MRRSHKHVGPIQILESRRLLAPLIVDGTTIGDTIVISTSPGTINVFINGFHTPHPDVFDAIIINAVGGNDSIVIQSNGDNPVIVNAGADNDSISIADPGTGDLGDIESPITVNGDAGSDHVIFNDANFSGTGTYNLSTTLLAVPGLPTVSFSTIDQLTLNCGSGADTINIAGAPAGAWTINGNNGNDLLNLATTGTLAASVLALVSFNGGGDTDTIDINDSSFAGGNEFMIGNSSIFGYGGPAHSWSGVEMATLRSGSGVNFITINISTAGARFTINSGAGDDNVTCVIGNPDAQAPRITIDTADGAADRITLSDTANNFDDGWIVQSAFVFRNFFLGMDYANAEHVALNCGNGPNRIDVNSINPTTNTTVNGGGGNDDIHINTTNGQIVAVNGQAGLDNVTVESQGKAKLLGSQDLAAVNVNGSGSLALDDPSDSVVTATSLAVASTAMLSLVRGTLLVDYTGATPLADIIADLTSGYAAGGWNGAGINIGAAAPAGAGVGYAEASDLFTTFPATFAGVTVDNTTAIVRYTLSGDTDLNRTTDIGDFARLAASFNVAPAGWVKGNSNYDNITDIGDFSLLAANFNGVVSVDAPRGSLFGREPIAFEPRERMIDQISAHPAG